MAEPFVDKIVEWVAQSQGLVRGDVVHDKLVAMGFGGSERTTRRVLSAAKVRGAATRTGSTSRGSRNRGCGCSGTTAMGR